MKKKIIKKEITNKITKSMLIGRMLKKWNKYSDRPNAQQINTTIHFLLKEIEASLKKGESVIFRDYFTFNTRMQSPLTKFNFYTKKKMKIPAKTVPIIKFSNTFKQRIKKTK